MESSERVGKRRRADRVRGVKVHAIEAGPAVPAPPGAAVAVCDVVLVHGLAISNRYLIPALRRLARDRRVLAPDLPGVGHSQRAGRPLTMVELADGLAEWMDAVGVEQAVVIGHSLGCLVAGHVAVRHPARVQAVVLASPAPDPRQGAWWQAAWRLLLDAPRERLSLLPIAISDYLRVGTLRMLRSLRQAKNSNAREVLVAITQPTLILRGDQDPLVSHSWAEGLTDIVPSASLVTVADAPHGLAYSSVDHFVSAVRTFLADCEGHPRDEAAGV